MTSNMIKQWQAMVGAENILSGDAAAPYLIDSYGRRGAAATVLAPRDVASLKKLVVHANQENYGLVPMGGNTGRSRGALPPALGAQPAPSSSPRPPRPMAIVSLKHFNKILSVNEKNNSMAVESGVVLAKVQDAARTIGRDFPLSLGSAGSCQVGGVLATNAGGYNVFRHGMARAHVLGLSVMLPNGEVLSQMTATRKNNVGYDLKQLFLGSEGTLGFILAATLALVPRVEKKLLGLLACQDIAAAVAVYHRYQAMVGPLLAGFELIPDAGRAMLVGQGKNIPPFFADKKNHAPFYLLVEIDNIGGDDGEKFIIDILAQGQDATKTIALAKNEREARELWNMREEMVLALRQQATADKTDNKPIARHDIALPLDAWCGDGAAAINNAVEKIVAGAVPFVFGHVGDGNLHYHFLCPSGMAGEQWRDVVPAIHDAVHGVVVKLGGSFSAEHGVGREKVAAWRQHQPAAVQRISHDIKNLLDPNNIMNPGVIFGEASGI